MAKERQAALADSATRSTFLGRVTVRDREIVVEGGFDPRKLTCSTAGIELRGHRRQWILGQVAHACADRVELRTIAIATLLLAPYPNQWNPDWQRVYPRQVDQWRDVDWDRVVSDDELAELKSVPEAEVKKVIAASLGEQHIAKDWGGETCDLYTDRLLIDGRQHSAAFLLKGPARFHAMRVADLGRQGDQIVRLSKTPSQIMVLQHCHRIVPEVISMLEDAASNFHRGPRRMMILDGYDTYRLLHARGVLPGG